MRRRMFTICLIVQICAMVSVFGLGVRDYVQFDQLDIAKLAGPSLVGLQPIDSAPQDAKLVAIPELQMAFNASSHQALAFAVQLGRRGAILQMIISASVILLLAGFWSVRRHVPR